MRKAACLLLALSGCSLFKSSTMPVTIMPSDPQAEIYADGVYVGKGTLTVELRRDRSHQFMAKLEDRAGVGFCSSRISSTGILDFFGGILFLFPLLGLLGPGSCDLEPQLVQIVIPPATQIVIPPATEKGK